MPMMCLPCVHCGRSLPVTAIERWDYPECNDSKCARPWTWWDRLNNSSFACWMPHDPRERRSLAIVVKEEHTP